MVILSICVLISSLSFLAYAISYFTAPKMKNEFKRFGLEKMGLSIIILEIIGALGLLAGLKFPIILILSSLGLTLLMLAGTIVRLKLRDSLLVSLPAFFYMLLNAFIFWSALKLQDWPN